MRLIHIVFILVASFYLGLTYYNLVETLTREKMNAQQHSYLQEALRYFMLRLEFTDEKPDALSEVRGVMGFLISLLSSNCMK